MFVSRVLPSRGAVATVSLLVLALQSGCGLIGPRPAAATGFRGDAWVEELRRQYQQTVEGIRSDLAVLDSDDDGLDQFGPAAAREMRAAKADLAMPVR
ncbi:MAG: hypothetical protein EBX36_05715 [Planctomycetia bacterium]|nr:hypothetical protein [Planctomycetia bacterium]